MASCSNHSESVANVLSDTAYLAPNFIEGVNKQGVLNLYANDKTGSGPGIELYSPALTSDPARRGAVHFVSDRLGNKDGEAFNFIDHDTANTWTSMVCIYKNGKMAIGNTDMNINANDYKLFVEKGILTEKLTVAVKNSAKWADYVFNNNYKLMPINKVASYARQNKHLPGIPSAAEVVRNGADLGEMNAKLLQKVEELTLYVAKQQKEIDELKKEIRKK